MSSGSAKIKGLDRKLKPSEVDFMKLIEEQNLERVLKLKQTRRNNILVGQMRKNNEIIFTLLISPICFEGGLLGLGVLGIYGYSMLAVKQEKFLDDFEFPETEEIKSSS